MSSNDTGDNPASREQAGEKREVKRVVLSPEEAREVLKHASIGEKGDCVKCGERRGLEHRRNHMHCTRVCVLCETKDHPHTMCPMMRQPGYDVIFTKKWLKDQLGLDDWPTEGAGPEPVQSDDRDSQKAKSKAKVEAPKNAPTGPKASMPAQRGGGGMGFGPPPSAHAGGGYGAYGYSPYGQYQGQSWGGYPAPIVYNPPPGAYGGGYGPGLSGDVPWPGQNGTPAQWQAYRLDQKRKKGEKGEKEKKEKEKEMKEKEEGSKEEEEERRKNEAKAARERERSPRREGEGVRNVRDRKDEPGRLLARKIRKARAQGEGDNGGDQTMSDAPEQSATPKAPEETQEDVEALRQRFLQEKAAFEAEKKAFAEERRLFEQEKQRWELSQAFERERKLRKTIDKLTSERDRAKEDLREKRADEGSLGTTESAADLALRPIKTETPPDDMSLG